MWGMDGEKNLELATFAAGCFWGVEESFRVLDGVQETAVGYMGGDLDNPSYEDVCGKGTGHAEVVQLKFDSSVISYGELLEVFWNCHNPTTLNRQGPDVGSQYRSGIFYHNDEQKMLAENSKKTLDESGKLDSPVVTEITEAGTFWRAEEYHQQYFMKRGGGACHV